MIRRLAALGSRLRPGTHTCSELDAAALLRQNFSGAQGVTGGAAVGMFGEEFVQVPGERVLPAELLGDDRIDATLPKEIVRPPDVPNAIT